MRPSRISLPVSCSSRVRVARRTPRGPRAAALFTGAAGLVAATALTTAVTAPLAAAPAQAAPSERAVSSLSVTGRGYGHGHGLSQWGAQGAALKGLGAQKILAFYYPGLKPGTAGGTVRVLISEDTRSDLVVAARKGLRLTALGATGKSRTRALDKAVAQRWRITPADGGRRSAVAYRARSGGWHLWRTVPGQAQVDAKGAPVTLYLPHGERVAYRGVLRSAAPSASSAHRDTVNVVSLEDYLKGVVPREAYPSWKPAALQAQAVAARTYAAFERRQPLARHYQICDTSACQVYGGYSSEVASTNRAIAATRGRVLLHGGQPAFTQFSASNGGWMAAGSEPYLVAKKDPYDTAYRGWTARVSAASVERAYPAIGTLTGATVVSGDGHGQWKGRVDVVRISGTDGSVDVDGDTFRSTFGLMSSWFTIG